MHDYAGVFVHGLVHIANAYFGIVVGILTPLD